MWAEEFVAQDGLSILLELMQPSNAAATGVMQAYCLQVVRTPPSHCQTLGTQL